MHEPSICEATYALISPKTIDDKELRPYIGGRYG
jgi:hypothetical protein